MFDSLSKLKVNKSISAIVAVALVALIVVAGCISTERSIIQRPSKTEAPRTSTEQSNISKAAPVQARVPVKQPSIPKIATARPQAAGVKPPQQRAVPKVAFVQPQAPQITPDQLQVIGEKIYKNETGGNVKNLIFWSKNEAFPSLGVGHFIWFPAGKSLGFTESFPSMIRYLKANGAAVPEWLSRQIQIGALWNSREQLEQERGSPKFQALQQLLIETSGLQVSYLFQRLDQALPKMLIGLEADKRDRIVDRFYTVRASQGGLYPLVDYVNFKGEGTVRSEKHNRVGWGLLQVLELMEPTPVGPLALKEFATAADLVLTRRVNNAPAESNEGRFLPGWRVRLRTYYQ